jgi:BirA family biotin operon repressor/biotin-[acetyl-CoA-carboxylase] ligase
MTLPTPDAVWTLATKSLGRRVAVYDCLDSTNSLALSLGDDPSQHGQVLLAREQTIGRGQYGRTWHAPRDTSVLMSMLLFPPPHLRRPVLLTAWAAVAVCETIRKLTNLQAKIKWPNDVLLLGKKVCGILIEQRTTSQEEFPLAAAVGIGLNVTQSADLFERACLPSAGSLASMSGLAFACEKVARELVRQMDEQYRRMDEGDFISLEAVWTSRLGLLNKIVVVEGIQQQYCGRLLDVTLAGLDLEIDSGNVMRLIPETIRHIQTKEDGSL